MVTGRSGTSRRARWAIASLAMASLLFGALAAGLGNLHASQQVAVGLPFAFTLLAGVTYELRSRTQHRQDGAQSAALASTEIARELRTLVKYRGLPRDADPAELGVSPSSLARQQAESASLPRPAYVSRAVDQELERCLRDLAEKSDGDRPRLVLLLGPSKSGKSRAAFEAVRRVLPDRVLVMPDPHNLAARSLDRLLELVPGDTRGGIVLWLDELDRFLDAGCIDIARLARWHRQLPGLVVVATLRDDLYSRYEETRSGEARGPLSDAANLLRLATVFSFGASWGPQDWERALEAYPGLRAHGRPERGLGVELICGPDLLRRFQVAENSSPAGFAVICAAIDWRRCGVAQAIRADELGDLAGQYLWRRRRAPMTDDAFRDALGWALKPVLPGAGISLLHFADASGENYEAVDYVVAYWDGPEGHAAAPDSLVPATWELIIGALSDDACFPVGWAALRRSRREEAAAAFSRSARSASPATAIGSLYELGEIRQQDGATEAARDAFTQIVARFGESDNPDIMRQVVMALIAMGISLDLDDRPDEAISVFDETIARFGSSADLPVLAEVARAMSGRGLSLSGAGRHDEAIAALNDVVARYGSSPEPFVDEAARSLLNRGYVLLDAGQPAEAIAAFSETMARFGSSAAIMPRAFATVARMEREGLLGVGHRLRQRLFPAADAAPDGTSPLVAFLVLLTDGNEASGLARLLQDVALLEADERALFAAPPVRGVTFLTDPDREWRAANVPPDAAIVYLLSHEDALPGIVERMGGTYYIGCSGAEQFAAYTSSDSLRLFLGDEPLAFASIVMADFSEPEPPPPCLFARSEASLMAMLAGLPVLARDAADDELPFGE